MIASVLSVESRAPSNWAWLTVAEAGRGSKRQALTCAQTPNPDFHAAAFANKPQASQSYTILRAGNTEAGGILKGLKGKGWGEEAK